MKFKKGFVIRKPVLTSRKRAIIIAELASDKKAEDIVVLDMRKVANFCDFFVVCSGTSDRHVRAIADGIEVGLKDDGLGKFKLEGLKASSWVVCDTGDVVAHVFHKDAREFYGLDYLWQEAVKVKWEK